MSEVHLVVNGRAVTVSKNSIVAAALVKAGTSYFRYSVRGEPRAFLCGMGICFECRVTINHEPNQLSCQVICEEGMQVKTEDISG